MPFNESQNLNESKNLFELALNLKATIYQEFKMKNISVLFKNHSM